MAACVACAALHTLSGYLLCSELSWQDSSSNLKKWRQVLFNFMSVMSCNSTVVIYYIKIDSARLGNFMICHEYYSNNPAAIELKLRQHLFSLFLQLYFFYKPLSE